MGVLRKPRSSVVDVNTSLFRCQFCHTDTTQQPCLSQPFSSEKPTILPLLMQCENMCLIGNPSFREFLGPQKSRLISSINYTRLYLNTFCLPMTFPVAMQPLDCMGLGNKLCSKSCLVIPNSENIHKSFVWAIYPT